MGSYLTGKRLPSLDGWRALSIAMVLGHHAQMACPGPSFVIFAYLSDGNLGVRCFFVISGFLITWLLLQEARATGIVNLGHFYVRRGLRILPVYYAFLLTLLLLQFFTGFRESPIGWLGLLTFTRDFTDGMAGHASVGGGHLWSLSVEEQFYLLWPGLFVWTRNCGLRAQAAWLAIPILTAPIFRAANFILYADHDQYIPGTRELLRLPSWSWHLFNGDSFFCYADNLACGCLAAIALVNHGELIAKQFKKWRWAVALGGFLLVTAPSALTSRGVTGITRPLCLTLGESFQAAGFCLLILQSALEPEWPAYRWLNWKWVAWIGALSYSIYIWQQIFYFRAWAGPVEWRLHPDLHWSRVCVVPVVAVAVVSYYALERPLFRLRSRFRE